MASAHRVRDLLLGVVFFAALFALAWITTQLRHLPGVGETYHLNVLVDDANGVRREDSVLVHGTRYGRVAQVRPVPESIASTLRPGGAPEGFVPNVLLVLELNHPIQLRRGYRIDCADANLLGGKVVLVDPGPPGGPPVDPGPTRPDLDPASAEDLSTVTLIGRPRSHALAALGRVVEENERGVGEIVENLRRASEALVEPERQGLLGFLLTDVQARKRGDNVLAALDELADQSRRPGSLVNDLFYDGPVRRNAVAILDKTREIVEKADDERSLIGALVTPESPLRRDVDQAVAEVRRFTDRLGREGSLLGRVTAEGPGSLGERADRIAANVDRWVEDALANRDSLVWRLAYGDTGKVLDRALDRVDRGLERFTTAVIDPIEEGRGLLGYVVNDPESRQKLERLISATLGIVEDAREAAPVTSLGSFLFGSF